MTTEFGTAALLDQLRPMLVGMAQEILLAAAAQAPVPRFLGATVFDYNRTAATVRVVPDGSTGAITPVASIVGMPTIGSRVMLMFVPGGGVTIVGYLGSIQSGARIGCKLRRLAAQSINSGAATAISWDTEDQDTDEFWTSGAPTLITIPAGLQGRYIVAGINAFAVATGGARSFVGLTASSYADAGGHNTYRTPVTPAGENIAAASGLFDLSAGDTVSFQVFQSNGVAVNTSARLEMWRIADSG